MKHALAFILTVLLIVPGNGMLRSRAPASKPGPKETIAHQFLEMERPLGAGDHHRAYLDGLIERARRKIGAANISNTAGAAAVLRNIDALLREEGFRFKSNYLLFRGIDSRSIDCDNYSALYVSIGETLGIPILPVYAPNHSFLRIYFEDGSYMNWEATEGKSLPDAHYLETLRVEASSLRLGVYMKTLSRMEFLGVEYNTMGACLMTAGRYAEALPFFDRAVRHYPQFSSAYHNRGSSKYAMGRREAALEDLLEAKRLDPGRASTRNTLGDIHFDGREYDRAIEEYLASIRLDPCFYAPYASIGLVMRARGDEEGARTWLRKAEEVKKKKCY
ncbi:MAG: tetratricopeptide repeat protein [Desulfococcus multivorans]|jgi:tetratricopeptide (TPR) repeat protein|nr:tetratricopeptide repeat protein [Desulfococcus multivorans]